MGILCFNPRFYELLISMDKNSKLLCWPILVFPHWPYFSCNFNTAIFSSTFKAGQARFNRPLGVSSISRWNFLVYGTVWFSLLKRFRNPFCRGLSWGIMWHTFSRSPKQFPRFPFKMGSFAILSLCVTHYTGRLNLSLIVSRPF